MTRLEQLRVNANLTRQQLGAAAGVHPSTITRIEEGKPAFAGTLNKLAAHFSVPASDLPRDALPVQPGDLAQPEPEAA